MSNRLKRVLVTGGAGFIGSAFIRYGLNQLLISCEKIVNLDLLTYAANLHNLASVEKDPRYLFVQGDIRDQRLVEKLIVDQSLDAIVHFAAESHVDRSIASPYTFYETNVGGTLALLEVVRKYPHVHFHHISTDEVFGALAEKGRFSEDSAYQPNSPYSASKAAADHFVRAYTHTYGLFTTLSYCSNNYGPGQHVEKLIPRMITSCLYKKPFPLYGQGDQVRDWIFVDDHVAAIWTILEHRQKGVRYAIGGGCERRNVDVLYLLSDLFADRQKEDPNVYRSLITPVADRPGHDFRYAIDSSKIQKETGWRPKHDFASGLYQTLNWYLENKERLPIL